MTEFDDDDLPGIEQLREDLPDLASGYDVFWAALIKAGTPEQELTVSEWADRYRKVAAESGSPFPGDWKTDRVPYLRQPLDCLHQDHPARRVTLKFSAQTGKSEVGVCWFGYIVDRAPSPILTVLPTLEEAVKYNRVKIQPTIDASPKIRHRVKAENSRDEGASTTSFKRFAGGFDQITTATSSKGLQMISVCNLILDEVSGFPADTDGRGHAVDQARARQKAYGERSKELMVSTPGEVGACRVTDEYEAGDRRELYMPCPQCGTFQAWPFEKMHGPANGSIRPYFVCDDCGGVVDQAHRSEMLLKHRWVPTWVAEGDDPVPALIPADQIDLHATEPCTGRVRDRQPSWTNWAAWSSFEQWSEVWKRSEEAFGDPVKMKAFQQQDLGRAYEAKNDTPDWEKLLACRKSMKRGVVPYPVAALYGFIDVQGSWVEWGLYGFGPGFQGFLLDRGIIAGDPSSDAVWDAIDALTARDWPTETGHSIPPNRWGIDTGAYTQMLYDRVSRRHGILACKGDNQKRAAPFKMSRAALRDERGNEIAGRRIDLALIGNFELKMHIYDGLRHLVAGPMPDGSWPRTTLHLPDWAGEDELKQLTSEVLVDTRLEAKRNAKRAQLLKPGDGREWRPKFKQRTEGLDIAVGCRALAWGDGAGSIDAARWHELVARIHRPRDKESGQADLFDRESLPRQIEKIEQTKVAVAPAAQKTAQPAPPPAVVPIPAPVRTNSSFIPRRSGWLSKR